MLGRLDNILKDHLTIASIFKYALPVILKEPLDCVYMVDLKNNINDANFISVQANETTD